MLIASKQEKVYFPSNLRAPYLTETSQNAPESDNNNNTEAAAIAEEADAAAGGGLRRFGSSHRIGSLHQFLSPVAGSPPAVSVIGSATNRRTPARTPRGGGGLDSSSDGLMGQDSQHSAAAAAAAANKSALLQRYREETSWGPRPGLAAAATAEATTKITPDWRLRDRMKTVSVGLVLALNVGTDPPDVVKPHPCAVLQCWMNPLKFSRAKAKEMIGERLEQQYANARSTSAARPLRYRRTLDPTVEDVRNVCLQLRRQARNDRVLLHYNGHGVPRPTDHGEIWVFDKNHTEYIPLPVTDLRNWLGKPSIVVLDCSAAGVLLPFLVNPLGGTTTPPDTNHDQQTGESSADTSILDKKHSLLSCEEQANQWVRETIVLAPCGPNELLSMDPAFPADIFTSCLTTPIPMALRWFVQRNPHCTTGLQPEAVDTIPGKVTDRKTPLGELNWIFTAVTDSIAWNVLPKHLFKRLFRQDLLVASLFRNFLLADRILRHLGCTPVSYPALPSAADHPLWQSWDLACETLLFQLIKNGVLKSSAATEAVSPPSSSNNSNDDSEQVGEQRSNRTTPAASPMTPSSPTGGVADTEVVPVENVSSPFFSEQLTAFEVWLDFSEIHKIYLASGTLQQSSPEQLPVVLQVLLFQVHRIRALKLMRRFLDLGPWAVNLSLSLGIYPYVTKLLQSPQYKSLLVSLWASILSFDPSLRVDLLRDGAFHHFVQHLMWGLDSTVIDAAEAAKERTLAAFVLSIACHGYPAGQVDCVRQNVHGSCCALLSSYEQGEHAQDDKTVELHLPAHFRLWLVICLASMVIDNAPIQNEAFSAGAHQRLAIRLQNDQNANVRAAVCYALGCLIGSQPKKGGRNPSQQDLADITSPQQQQQQLAPSQASFPQGLVAPAQIPNLGLPNSIAPAQLPTNQLGQAHLRPNLAPTTTTGVSGLALAGPQHMQAMQGGPIQPTTVATTSGGQGPPTFWNQAVQLRPTTQAAPIQTPYILQGQPLGAAGFLVGSAPIVGQPPLVDPAAAFPIPVPEPQTPSVFEDRHRLELDLSCIEMLVKGTEDASVVVRYEACVGLACAVNKYLEAFVYVAGESVAADMTAFPALPLSLDLKTKQKFKSAWMTVRSLQKDDVFPPVSKAANDIVLFVNENLLRLTALDNDQEREIGKEGSSLRGGRAGMVLAGISEDTDTFQDRTSEVPTDNGKVTGTIPLKCDLRRVASEVTNPDKGDSMKRKAELDQSTRQRTASGSKIEGALVYSLPKSKYYSWQKDAFDYKLQSSDDDLEIDPLSPEGARLLYEKRRNSEVKNFARKLSEHFSCLAPKPPKPEKKGLNFILEEENEENVLAMEEDLSKKKRELELKEAWLLQNEGTKMTLMVRFHPYEDYLVSCDGSDQISSWDTSTGKRLTIFSNGNPEDSRMTTTCWINEKSQNILLVGSDDGAVKLWGGLAKPQNEICSPALVSAFHALPMNAERRQSGLVCEWQPSSGKLVAAGSSKYINCWDLEAEKLSLQIDTNTAAPITSLTTAWDHDPLDPSILPPTSTGLSPNIVVAGLGDGALRIFDVRSHRSGQDLDSRQPSRLSRRHGPRATQYSEHKSWVVSTAFTNYANKYEIISGTLSGEVKAWDLRMSSSIRTVEVQRSVMTALAVHPRIPIMATGSHAQFIKLQTPDGDFLQVLRYHEKMANHRIGPVSCVAFHPHKPILAAGATDNYIGVYAPKNSKFL